MLLLPRKRRKNKTAHRKSVIRKPRKSSKKRPASRKSRMKSRLRSPDVSYRSSANRVRRKLGRYKEELEEKALVPGTELDDQRDQSIPDDQAWRNAYDQAWRNTYDQGWRSAYDQGFDTGFYEGGDGILTQMIPPFTVLPNVELREVLQAGLSQMQHLLHPLVDPFTLYREMKEAMDSGKPMSIVRLGDGEMLTLSHDLIIPADQARQSGPFLAYAGVSLPDPTARQLLADSIRRATIVGIPVSRMRSFQGMLFPALRAHGIDYRGLRMTISTINYLFYQLGYLTLLLEGRRVLVVGNEAHALGDVLASRGVRIVGIVTPVQGIHDVDRVVCEIGAHAFDIALVAAGIPAVIISERVATELGRVAIDFGHLANKLVKGEPI